MRLMGLDVGSKTVGISAHTRDAEVDVDAYIEYLNGIDDDVHVFAQVDKIPGKFRHPKTREELAEAPEMSWNNYLYMRERLKSPEKLLPIFHQGEDFKWLHNILDYRSPEGDKYSGNGSAERSGQGPTGCHGYP